MYTDPDDDNHANQCNPNNDEYWHSREQARPTFRAGLRSSPAFQPHHSPRNIERIN
jgi:hypothetical protein